MVAPIPVVESASNAEVSPVDSAAVIISKPEDEIKPTPKIIRPSRPVDSTEKLARTLFFGNLTVKIAKDRKIQRSLRALIEAVVPVESMRFRSLVEAKPTGGKRIAFITGQLNAKVETCNAYVVLKDVAFAKTVISTLNGVIFEGYRLRVDHARVPASSDGPAIDKGKTKENLKANSSQSSKDEEKLPTKKSIFLGNLPLSVSDEVIWEAFEGCGKIQYVRIIRDRISGLGKGFGYVCFAERSSVELAIQLNGSDISGRPVRISKCAKPGYQQAKKAFIQKKEKLIEKKQQLSNKNGSRVSNKMR